MTSTAKSEPEQASVRGRSPVRTVARLALLFLSALVVLAAGAGVAGYLAYDHITRPGTPGEVVRVTIPQGATGRDTGRILAEQGLVEHEIFFRLAMRLADGTSLVKYGRYDLPKGLSPTQLLELLNKGPNVPLSPDEIPDDLKVTAPEGLTLAQMAALFDDPEAFLEAASAPDLRARVGIQAPTLEGFLMPDTYYFAEKPSPRDVVERMVEEFEKTYASLLSESPAPAGFDKMSLVTIASLIEEEAKTDEERPWVAAVIYNRLARGMPLDLDCTLQYALGKYGQPLLNSDKEVDSPFNTYRRAGLPPGPISNPGRASLRAALQPSGQDYLYFVSNADGRTHTFSKTLQEHNRAVARFHREIREQRLRLRQEENQDAG